MGDRCRAQTQILVLPHTDIPALRHDERTEFRVAAESQKQPVPCDEHASLNELCEENQRLRQQLRRAEMEREILKKATAYFARESL